MASVSRPQSMTGNAANRIGLSVYARHARPCPGHDEKAGHFQAVGKSLKMLDALPVRP